MFQEHTVEVRRDVKIPMRDGVNLSADIYLPKTGGPFPTVLGRTAFDRTISVGVVGGDKKGLALAKSGYACVFQNFRGRYDSEGTTIPFHNEGKDGYDTQQWIGQQPWCNGKIGTIGASYMGIVQWQSAQYSSENLVCMVPRVAALDHVADALAPGGTFQLTWLMAVAVEGVLSGQTRRGTNHYNWTEVYRTLPLVDFEEKMGIDLPFWKSWIQQPLDHTYWTSLKVASKWGDIVAPASSIGGWYDIHVQSSFAYFNGQRQHGSTPASRETKLMIGPWTHIFRTGEIDFGDQARVDLDAVEMRWLDHWLKGVDNGVVDEPPLRLFIMGINKWRDEHEWPLARTRWEKWYLHSNGSSNTLRGDGHLSPETPNDEPSDHYVYDPEYPAQTIGGNSLDPSFAGPRDQRPVEMRNDVLCYTSTPVVEEVEVTGPIKLVLYAATDGLDTDWTAKLVDVSSTGYAKILCDGIVRARYRHGFSQPTLLTPNQVYEYEIELGVTGNVFCKGHSLRLEVSSSNFPRFDRNPNTGHPVGMDTEMRAAQQTIHHSHRFPSHLVLPVIPMPE